MLKRFFLILIFSSCYAVHIVAPDGERVRLAQKYEQKRRVIDGTRWLWYMGGGLFPINENFSDGLIKELYCHNVRVTSIYSGLNILANFGIAFFLLLVLGLWRESYNFLMR